MSLRSDARLALRKRRIKPDPHPRYNDNRPKKYALIPVVQMTEVMMMVRVIGVVVTVVVAIVMMVMTMRITVPSCGWSRAADCDCANKA
jgi:hypothetical protein